MGKEILTKTPPNPKGIPSQSPELPRKPSGFPMILVAQASRLRVRAPSRRLVSRTGGETPPEPRSRDGCATIEPGRSSNQPTQPQCDCGHFAETRDRRSGVRSRKPGGGGQWYEAEEVKAADGNEKKSGRSCNRLEMFSETICICASN